MAYTEKYKIEHPQYPTVKIYIINKLLGRQKHGRKFLQTIMEKIMIKLLKSKLKWMFFFFEKYDFSS